MAMCRTISRPTRRTEHPSRVGYSSCRISRRLRGQYLKRLLQAGHRACPLWVDLRRSALWRRHQEPDVRLVARSGRNRTGGFRRCTRANGTSGADPSVTRTPSTVCSAQTWRKSASCSSRSCGPSHGTSNPPSQRRFHHVQTRRDRSSFLLGGASGERGWVIYLGGNASPGR
jgi:hypothetical protein